ncbi:MAG TPA: hypothetical protein DCQ98_17655 [Planctomycetaceae bacterium]|nr:hypothetical protein [Planctomycetaceae bacterium]HRF00435.1 hypothetical protein [Pirellulaceae bacterium]
MYGRRLLDLLLIGVLFAANLAQASAGPCRCCLDPASDAPSKSAAEPRSCCAANRVPSCCRNGSRDACPSEPSADDGSHSIASDCCRAFGPSCCEPSDKTAISAAAYRPLQVELDFDDLATAALFDAQRAERVEAIGERDGPLPRPHGPALLALLCVWRN